MGGDAVASSKSNLDLGRKKPRRTEAEIKRDCEKRLEADETLVRLDHLTAQAQLPSKLFGLK